MLQIKIRKFLEEQVAKAEKKRDKKKGKSKKNKESKMKMHLDDPQ